MAKKPSYADVVAKDDENFVVGKGGHIKPVSEYKRTSYDIHADQHLAIGQAALDSGCRRNAIIRAMISIFMEDQEVHKQVIERAKRP